MQLVKLIKHLNKLLQQHFKSNSYCALFINITSIFLLIRKDLQQMRQQNIERALNNLDTFIAELKQQNNKHNKGEQ